MDRWTLVRAIGGVILGHWLFVSWEPLDGDFVLVILDWSPAMWRGGEERRYLFAGSRTVWHDVDSGVRCNRRLTTMLLGVEFQHKIDGVSLPKRNR